MDIYIFLHCFLYIRGYKFLRGIKYRYIDIWINKYIDISSFLGVSHMDIEIYGNLDIWMNKQMDISSMKYGYMDILIYRYTSTSGVSQKQGFQVSQGYQIWDIWIYWYMDTWIYEYLDEWIMNIWK